MDNQSKKSKNKRTKLSRRDFLKSSASAGVGMALAGNQLKGTLLKGKNEQKPLLEKLNIAFIGTGEQGRILIESCLRIPSVQIRAICDIWEYSQIYASRYLKKYGHMVNVYEDYREMINKEKNLDAVIIATPDWVHAEQTNACLNAGLHVYCEKEMSNSLTGAKSMVETARKTNKLLQIGHQRRSNPRYKHAIGRLILKKNLLGRLIETYAQWNHSKSLMRGWPKKYTMSQSKLEKYGYSSMTHLRNWRWFRKYSGGPIVDLGSHQIDLFSWVFGVNPTSVMASGGNDYYKNREWYDNVIAVYEFKTQKGTAKGLYQVQTATKHGGFYETFIGENGSLVISEIPQKGNWAFREAHAPEWDSLVKEGYLKSQTQSMLKIDTKNIFLDVRVTAETGRWPLPTELSKPVHQPHLENFFNAIRYHIPLNCPAETGFETAVSVLTVNKAVESNCLLKFNKKDFKA